MQDSHHGATQRQVRTVRLHRPVIARDVHSHPVLVKTRSQQFDAVPQQLTDERGRLIDLISDMHQYFYGKTAALWGDPDTLVGLADLLYSVDVLPRFVVTGTPGKAFLKRISEVRALSSPSGAERRAE